MSDVLRPDSELATAIGRVAQADSQVDEWLVQLLSAILADYPSDVVRLLVAGDNARAKFNKTKKLLQIFQLDQQPEVQATLEALRDFESAKQSRDIAVHSFYDARSDEESLRSFRSRSGHQETNVSGITAIAGRLESISAALAQLTHQIELAHARRGDIGALMEECRELLCAAKFRIDDERLPHLRSGEVVRVAMLGTGRWRALPDGEQSVAGETVAELDTSTGRISLSLPDGSSVEGGDTGWQDATEHAQQTDPGINMARVRRLHGNVSLVQDGGEFVGATDFLFLNELSDRIFGPLADGDSGLQIPEWVRTLPGFAPPG